MAQTEDAMESENWEMKFREDEEMEFFTELALHETERWIQAVTRKTFMYPDDPRKSLEDGILLCELLNSIKNSSVKRINRQSAPIAGLDNVNVFLRACQSEFGLSDTQLFDPADLEDLSQRAIAESDHLQQESERRLRNVAITIYWLGRAVYQNYPIPSLDFSAFTPLINHNAKDIISNDYINKQDNSWESYDHSSAYESHPSNLKDSFHTQHYRDSSYESYASYGKGSEDSLDEQVYENMPVGRFSSATSKTDGGQRYSVSNDNVYREDRYNGMYRSSPDLAGGLSYNHHRSSSTDSLDGSYRGSHSRQSSDSCDGYPTRNMSTRRTSSAVADPLQFIKSSGANLAKQAEEQIKQVEEIKKIKTSVSEMPLKGEEDDWQSSLGDWKSRRKSRSEAFQIKEEMQELERKKAEEDTNKTNSVQKSYKQIQEEREKRKSVGTVKSFYPLDDDDDDNDAFISPIKSSTTESSQPSFNKITSSTPSHKSYKSDVAGWARDSDSETGSGDESGPEDKHNQTTDNKTKDSQSNNEHNTSHNINNNNKDYSSSNKTVSNRFKDSDSKGIAENVLRQNSRNTDITSKNKINNIRNRFESPEDKPLTRTAVYDAKVNLSERKKSFENFDKSSDSDIGKPPKPYPRERSGNNVSTESSLYSSSKLSGKDFVEKNIKITGSRHNSGGFGFTISGGADRKQPITVDRVSLDNSNYEYLDDSSASDVCGLKTKDEILLVNKTDVSRLTNNEVSDLVQEAALKGQIEIRVKRFLDSNAEDSDEFISSDEEEEDVKPTRQTRETTQSFDSNFSQEEEPNYNNNNNNSGSIEKKTNSLSENIPATYNYADQPLMHQLKNDASLIMQMDPQNDSSYQSGENASQGYSSYASSNNASSLDNSDYVNTGQPVTTSSNNTNSTEPQRSDNTYVRTRISHHDYVNTSNIDTWGYGNHHDDAKEPEVVMRKKNQSADDSIHSSSSYDEADRVKSPDLGSSDSDGPPAILRKWQRQRPKSEYKFQEEKPLINQKRLSATLPWQPEHRGIEERSTDPVLERAARDFNDTVSNQPVPSPRINQFNQREDRKRIEEWNNQSEQQRQPDDMNAVDINNHTSYNNQVEYEANRDKIQKQYEEDKKRAAEIQEKNQQKEAELLEPEMERMRLLEQRKQERRKRLQELHQDNTSIEPITSSVASTQQMTVPDSRANTSYNSPQYSMYQDDSRPTNNSVSSHPVEITQTRATMSYSAPQHHTYQNIYEPNYVNQPSDVTTMNIHVTDGRHIHHPDPNQPAMAFMLPTSQSGGLVIDPRNRMDDSEPVPQYSIQLNLNQREPRSGLIIKPALPAADAHFLEQEKEKIRQEYQKFEETFRQQQDEEDRKFREREEKLRQQEERLRQEEERLRLEEEKFERQKKNLLNKSSEFTKSSDEPKFHNPVQTRVRGQSAIHKSTISTPNRTESKPSTYSTSMVIDSNRGGRHNLQKVDPKWPPSNKPKVGNISVRRSNDQWPPSGKTIEIQKSNSANKISKDSLRDRGDVQTLKSQFQEPSKRKSWSREDMMAMNRKATPLQSKPDSGTGPNSPTSIGPIKREIPTRQEIHSLNAVPKPKLRQSVDWIEKSEPNQERRASQRRSEVMKNQYSNPLQEHWLVEEAERRRMNSELNMKSSTMPIQPGPYNGPIKPPRDPNNVWSDSNPQLSQSYNSRVDPNMPMQIRQTLLQKTANVRSPGGNNSQDINGSVPQISRNPYLTQTLPANYNYGSQGVEYGAPHMVSHQPPPTNVSNDPGLISGKKLCSFCHQELGFGAAMIIEKLGLFYHMTCFKCCVCRTPLGNGVEGADVRIRVNKLHCPNCYSNDEGIANME